MRITSTRNIRPNQPLPEARTVKERVATYVTEHPVKALGDVADLAVVSPLAFGEDLGAGKTLAVLSGGLALMRAAVAFDDLGKHGSIGTAYRDERRSLRLKAAGNGLTALGLGLASFGAGPLSLVPVALGKAALLLDSLPKSQVYDTVLETAENVSFGA